jgi:transposase
MQAILIMPDATMKMSGQRALFRQMVAFGMSDDAIGRALERSRRTLQRWARSPRLQDKTRNRASTRKVTAAATVSMLSHVRDNPSTTLKAAIRFLDDEHGVTVDVSTLSRHLKKVGFTLKKATKAYCEFNEERGQAFLTNIQADLGPHLLSLDECGFFMNHVRGYAWSQRGKRAVVKRPGPRGKKFSLLLCISSTCVVKWNLYQGSVDSVRFLEFLQELPMGSKIVLDNAAIHKSINSLRRRGLPTVAEAAEEMAIDLQYLPPYAPHLNPVELCFNILRTHINGEAPRNEAELRAALEEGLEKLTPTVCSRLFRRVLGPGA